MLHGALPTFWSNLSVASFVLIEISYLPQIVRLHRVKEAHEFHVLYPLLNVLGRIIGFVASIALHRQDITIGFALGIVVRFTLLGQVLYYRRREFAGRRFRLEQVSV
ncbi:MAG: PQ-loop repeat-containing protein [Chloroflexi bacterium]|nr:PQ-loop repeat-containing protein [Chloroflexota bacterium]